MGLNRKVATWKNRQRYKEPLELDYKTKATHDGVVSWLIRWWPANHKEIIHDTSKTTGKLMAPAVLNRRRLLTQTV